MKALRRKTLSILTVMTMLSFSLVVFIPAAVAAPQTFTVTSTADSPDANPGDGVCETATPGECTFRAAVQESNANEGADTIEFNIPGDPSTVHVISPATHDFAFTDEVHINGYSQPGASANTAVSPNPINAQIRIELAGTNPTSMSGGLVFLAGSEGSSVRGLSIYDFALPAGEPNTANVVLVASNVTVAGNFLGLKADGFSIGEGQNDISVLISDNATNYNLGGVNPADRNMLFSFSETNTAAAVFGGAEAGEVYGNYFGIARDGVTDLTPGEADVVGLQGPWSMAMNFTSASTVPGNIGNTVGGPNAGQANVISGGTVGVILSSVGNIVQGNYIGTDYTGQVNENLTNGVGVTVTAGSYNLIGGTGAGEGNIIAGTKGAGVLLSSFEIVDVGFTLTPEFNSVIGNSIYDIGVYEYSNFGTSNVGIDLVHMIDVSPSNFVPDVFEQRGPNPNDEGDVDTGANGFINFPVLKSAVQVGSNLEVTFDLDAAGSSDGDYRVEFFANDRSTIFGYGPGQDYLGSATVQNGEDLVATIDVGAGDISYKSLSATATAASDLTPWGYGNTSEFSQNIQIGSELDVDADGISSSMENLAPNNGDGNNDGIPDRLQPTISSYVIGSTPVTFVTDGCSANGSVSSLQVDSLDSLDSGYAYPYGLTDFSLNCSRGDTVTVTKYVYDDASDDLANYSVRKYIPHTDEYIEVEEATVERQDINGNSALVLSYAITDGGQYDDDGVANGVIVDPVGLARVLTSSNNTDDTGQTGNNQNSSSNGNGSAAGDVNSATGTLVNTGANNLQLQVLFAIIMLAAGLSIISVTGLPKLTKHK